jgi:hypothetical protein
MFCVWLLLVLAAAQASRASPAARAHSRAACEAHVQWVWREGRCVEVGHPCRSFRLRRQCPLWCEWVRREGCTTTATLPPEYE